MLRDCYLAGGTGKLASIKGKRERAKYKQRFMFQEENDPKHMAKATKECPKTKKDSILEITGQNLDLKSIENQ